MGWFDDMLGKARRRAQEEAVRYAAKKAKDRARRTLDAVANDFLEFAEGELKDAQERRGTEGDAEEEARQRAAAEREARRQARAEREQKAREELEKLKREAFARSRRRAEED